MDHESSESHPVGIEFRPTEVELVKHYLKGKTNGTLLQFEEIVIKDIQVYKFDPWVLVDKSPFQSRDRVWHFFSRRAPRYPGESSHNRPLVDEQNVRTPYGIWLATGEEGYVRETPWSPPIGKKRTLVFHRFSDNGNIHTEWTVHEYTTIPEQGRYVLCRLNENPEGLLASNMASNSSIVTVEGEADHWHNSAALSSIDPLTDKAELKGVESEYETFWPDSVTDFIDDDDYLYSHIPLEAFLYQASPDVTILSTMGESLLNANVEQSEGFI